MANSLKSRIERIARSMPRGAGKFVIIGPECRADEPPIAWTGAGGANLSLRVPHTAGDPREHLTDEQRAMIGRYDQVIVMHFAPGSSADA